MRDSRRTGAQPTDRAARGPRSRISAQDAREAGELPSHGDASPASLFHVPVQRPVMAAAYHLSPTVPGDDRPVQCLTTACRASFGGALRHECRREGTPVECESALLPEASSGARPPPGRRRSGEAADRTLGGRARRSTRRAAPLRRHRARASGPSGRRNGRPPRAEEVYHETWYTSETSSDLGKRPTRGRRPPSVYHVADRTWYDVMPGQTPFLAAVPRVPRFSDCLHAREGDPGSRSPGRPSPVRA